MGIEGKLSGFWSGFQERLNQQVWFQELKEKWDELDPKNRLYIKIAGVIGTLAFCLISILGSVISTYQLRSDLASKNEILRMIQSAQDEMRELRNQIPPSATVDGARNPEVNWADYLRGIAQTNGIESGNLEISPEKPGTATDSTREALIDLKLTKTTIRKVVQFAFAIQSGEQPMKLRNLAIDTDGTEGYVNSTISISGFRMVDKK